MFTGVGVRDQSRYRLFAQTDRVRPPPTPPNSVDKELSSTQPSGCVTADLKASQRT